MSFIRGRIMDVSQAENDWNVSFLLEKPVNVLPGQYFKVRRSESGEILSSTVFPILTDETRLQGLPVAQPVWRRGEEIQLFGPFGKTFTLPEHKSRVGIYVPANAPAICLLPLIEKTLTQGHEVTLVSSSFLSGLLAEVEVLPLNHAGEVFAWADYLASVALLADIRTVSAQILPLRPRLNRPREDELLVLAEMPCAGMAVCEMCSLQTKSGWKHACKEGPVFNLTEFGGL